MIKIANDKSKLNQKLWYIICPGISGEISLLQEACSNGLMVDCYILSKSNTKALISPGLKISTIFKDCFPVNWISLIPLLTEERWLLINEEPLEISSLLEALHKSNQINIIPSRELLSYSLKLGAKNNP